MRLVFLCTVFVAAAVAVAQQPDRGAFDVFIKRLGNSDFRLRDAATEELKNAPKSASALREALRSPNPEIARRAAIILEYHDRRPLRELTAAVKDGRIQDVVEILAGWPNGKYEGEAWKSVVDLTRTIDQLHEKQGGKRLNVAWLRQGTPVVVVTEAKVKDVRNNAATENGLPCFFVRTREVALAPPEEPRSVSGYYPGGAFVATGPVKVRPHPLAELMILAGGDAEIGGIPFRNIIISCGDVAISTREAMFESIVIARGKVTCTGVKMGNGCRIISGKTVVYDKNLAGNCIITENDSNPLGFIRWADAPKEKALPKAK